MKRSLINVFVLTVMVLLLVMLNNSPVMSASDQIVLKVGHVSPTESPYQIGAEKFAELVSYRTNGKIKVTIFPNGALAPDERELLEGTQKGLVDIAWSSTGNIAGFVKDIQILDLPYLFVNPEHVNMVVDGYVGRQLMDQFDKLGFKGLAFHEDGWRVITSDKPIRSLKDMSGFKIRAMMNPMYVDMYKAMGADPTPISWAELYTSLQMGVVKGQDNSVTQSQAAKFFEVQKAVAITNHFYSAGVVVIGLGTWKKLTPEQQQIVEESALEASHYQKYWANKKDIELTEVLKKKGITVTYPDREPFVKAVQPVYATYLKQYPHWETLIKQIRMLAPQQ